ncbi:2,3-diaminopropionate biosynthesis protein SbnA [Galbibacter sp.]|uniref:2,3-diaminopropionate biosynthesis protein SbnA n=1 Tax=Galbibacter sp. TaxID=2918471 RepID=UPI003A91E4EA
MQSTYINKKKGILDCVGDTPLVRLSRIFPQDHIRLYAKLEMFNPGGSIKDRTADYIIRKAEDKGAIGKSTILIESTSGNMGIALARICHYMGLKLLLVTDPHINPLAEKIMKAYGAVIIPVDQGDGNGGYLNARLEKVQELLNEIPDSFWPDQYHNPNNPLAHEKTFQEILESLGHVPDYIFIPVSTCGTLRGFANTIEKYNATTKVIAVDAVGSVIFGGAPGRRLIPGMGASRPSDFLKTEQVFDMVTVSDRECIEGCRELLEKESILAGGSSGAVIKAIEKKLPEISANATVIALLPDNGERYLDTIYSEEWVKEHFGK